MDSDSAAVSVASDYPPAFDASDQEELDELASENDEEPVERVPGESLLPSLRLESIIKADGVMGTLALSKEGLFILSVATEEFVKRLAQGGHRQASAERRTSVSYRDMAATTQQYQEFMFLQETIPFPVSLKEALELRDLKQQEVEKNDPALTALAPLLSADGSSSKPKPKPRPNGKDKSSRHASSTSRSESRAHSQVPNANTNGHASEAAASLSSNSRSGRDGAWPRWANGQGYLDSAAAAPSFTSLGHQQSVSAALNGQTRPADAQPLSSLPPYWQRATAAWKPPLDSSRPNSSPNGHTPSTQSPTGSSTPSANAPAAPSAPVPSTLIAENPGRTIYSQAKPPPPTQ